MSEFAEKSGGVYDGGQIMVVGAGGTVANTMYLPKLVELGVDERNLVLVDKDPGRLASVAEYYARANSFRSIEEALNPSTELSPNRIIICSNTAAHADNFRSVADAVEQQTLDPDELKIWSEKPTVAPESFPSTAKLIEQYGMNVTLGYILRYSGVLPQLVEHIREQEYTITGMSWEYGKDRSKDTRPTQGVLADEFVHPLSVTDFLLKALGGEVAQPVVRHATVLRRPFANADVQAQARKLNPDIPTEPISDVYADMEYNADGQIVPVHVTSSFKLRRPVREASIYTRQKHGSKGTRLLLLFDERSTTDHGKPAIVDRVVGIHGEEIATWSGDKATLQMEYFLGRASADAPGSSSGSATPFDVEKGFQDTLATIAKHE